MANAQKQTITLRTVLHAVQDNNAVFSLKFRKLDGSVSIKPEVKKSPGKSQAAPDPDGKVSKNLSAIKRTMKGAGVLLLFDIRNRYTFEAKVELLVEFNGMTIFHNY